MVWFRGCRTWNKLPVGTSIGSLRQPHSRSSNASLRLSVPSYPVIQIEIQTRLPEQLGPNFLISIKMLTATRRLSKLFGTASTEAKMVTKTARAKRVMNAARMVDDFKVKFTRTRVALSLNQIQCMGYAF